MKVAEYNDLLAVAMPFLVKQSTNNLSRAIIQHCSCAIHVHPLSDWTRKLAQIANPVHPLSDWTFF